MKKLIMFVVMCLLFTQCRKDENDYVEETAKTVPVTLELSLCQTRSDFMDLFPLGKINWGNENKEESIYLSVSNRYLYYDHDLQYTVKVGELFELKAEVNEPTDKLVFRGEIPQNLLWTGKACKLYYFGNNGRGEEGANVTNIYDTKYPDCLIGKRVSFAKQNGSLEELGNYHIASSSVKVTAIKDADRNIIGFDLSAISFTSNMSLALLDLEGVTTLGGSATDLKSYTVMWANNSEFIETYEIDDASKMDVSDNVGKKSFIALLPSDGDVGLECDKGSYYFEGGIQSNQVYVERNGNTPDNVLPLIWETP